MSMGMAVAMLVTTMLAMMMVVIMVVTVVVVMMRTVIVTAVIMFGMVVARMILRFVRVTITGIGAAFRIERRFDLDYPRAQPFHHAFDDVIATYAQSFAHDLCRQMTVAEMPGDAN